MKKYSNPQVTYQDMMIGRAFKNYLHRGVPTVGYVPGFVPVWGWVTLKPSVVGFERNTADCYLLPISGGYSLRAILAKIRRDRPVNDFTWTTAEGIVATKAIGSLTEGQLVSVLKNLSLVIYPDDNSRNWITTKDGSKLIALKMERLSTEGRMGRRPLRGLLIDYAKAILKTGQEEAEFYYQLSDEHRLSTDEVELFYHAAIKLKSELADISDKARRLELKKELSQAIDMYCDLRQKKVQTVDKTT